MEGEKYDTRIYCYEGHIYELFTLMNLSFDPTAGNEVMEAQGLSFQRNGDVIEIKAQDKDGQTTSATIALRSKSEVRS